MGRTEPQVLCAVLCVLSCYVGSPIELQFVTLVIVCFNRFLWVPARLDPRAVAGQRLVCSEFSRSHGCSKYSGVPHTPRRAWLARYAQVLLDGARAARVALRRHRPVGRCVGGFVAPRCFIVPQSRYIGGLQCRGGYNFRASRVASARAATHTHRGGPVPWPRAGTPNAFCVIRRRAVGRGARADPRPARFGFASRGGSARCCAQHVACCVARPSLRKNKWGCSVPGGLRRRGRGEPPRLSLDIPLKAYGMRSTCVRRVHSRSHLHPHAHSHACTRIRSRARAHTNAHTRPRAHARMHARTNKTPSTRAHTHRYAPAILSNNQ